MRSAWLCHLIPTWALVLCAHRASPALLPRCRTAHGGYSPWVGRSAVMALLACHRSPCLALGPTAKGTGITTGKKTAGLEPSAEQGSTMLMSNSASSRDWQLKAEYYSISDTHSRNEAKPLAQEPAAAAAL